MGLALRGGLSVLIGGWQLEREGPGGVGGPQGGCAALKWKK